MKTYLILSVFTLLFAATSCRKATVDPTKGLSAKIQSIVPQATLDDLKAKGMTINEGSQPPNIDGIYQANPYQLLAPYSSEDGWAKGKIITDYRFRFSGQSGDDVKVEEKQVGTSNAGTGVASFLAGSGGKFTLFGEVAGTQSGISYKQLTVISGEVTATGIKDFQYAFVFTSKNGDAGNTTLIPINKARIWIDGNALAEKVATYRRASTEEPETVTQGTPGSTR